MFSTDDNRRALVLGVIMRRNAGGALEALVNERIKLWDVRPACTITSLLVLDFFFQDIIRYKKNESSKYEMR